MKKLLRIISAAAAVLLVLPLFVLRVSAAEEQVSLGDRADLMTAHESLDGIGMNAAHSGEKLKTWQLTFKKGIGMHCLPDKDAYIEFDISSLGMKYFYATVGVLQEASYFLEWGSISFSVYGDGALLAQTPEIDWGKKPYFICVDVEGVKLLRLTQNNCGNYACDAGIWGDAMLCNEKPETPEWQSQGSGGFDPDKTDEPQPAELVSGDHAYISDLYWSDNHTYTGNIVGRDCNTANEIIFSTDGKFFSKGVGFHASSSGYTSYIDVNIDGLGFTKFAAYCGVCETLTSYDITMASVKFALIGDGKTLYESDLIVFGEPMQPMEADITGVSVLRLAVAGIPSISGAWATWGGAVISKSGNITSDMLYTDDGFESLFGTTGTTDTEPAAPADDTACTEDVTDGTAELTGAPGTEAQPEEKNGGRTALIVAIAAAVTVLAGAGVFLLLKKRK